MVAAAPVFTLPMLSNKIMRTIDCQTDITWMHKDKPQTVNYRTLLSRTKNTGIQRETLSNDIHLSSTTENQKANKNNRKASSSQSKDETSKARQIKDVELKESEHLSRSPSPKGRIKTTAPILSYR